MDDDELDDRITYLEAAFQVQAQIVTAMQAERIEAERLTESVGRLGQGADALSAALLQVDKNQQQLTGLDRHLAVVEERSATKKDVEQQNVVTTNRANRTAHQISAVLAAVVLVAVISILAGYLIDRQSGRNDYAACRERRALASELNTFLQSVADNSIVPAIKQSAANLIASSDPEVCEVP